MFSAFNNLKIGVKLAFTFGVLTVAFIGFSIFSINRLDAVNETATEMFTVWLDGTRVLGELRSTAQKIRASEGNYLIDEKSHAETLKAIQTDKETFAKLQKEYEGTIIHEDDRALFNKLAEKWDANLKTNEEFIAKVNAGDIEVAKAVYTNEGEAAHDAATGVIQDMIKLNSDGGKVANDRGDELFAQSEKLTIGAGALVMLLTVLSLVALIRSISRPLKGLTVDIERLSNGDYSKELDGGARGDEIGQMVKSLNNNVRKIRDIVTNIKHTAGSVNSAAGEIASGSTDLSVRTEQQASSLEETAASMEEITGTVKQNSSNAGNANNLSTNASAIANEGGKVVEQAVLAMASIEKSSQKISDIIGVIDEIAFQTNLLALNAAVEAARAGDAGKGFAVVASEVRSLAGRSATASKEIKTLINESASQVQTGAELVNKAGTTLKGIVDSVKQVAGIVSEIASASAQQASGIDEINTAVTQMDEVTQQNAALVEENTAAAQSMLEQAKALENLMRFFKVDDSQADSSGSVPVETAKVETLRQPALTRPTASAKRPAAKPTHKPAAKAHTNGHAGNGAVAKAALSASKAQEGWEEF